MIIDVRTPEEYEEGHVQGAVNIPVGDIEEGHFGALADGGKDIPLQLYCRSGARSAYACALLQSAGFTSVTNLGSMDAATVFADEVNEDIDEAHYSY